MNYLLVALRTKVVPACRAMCGAGGANLYHRVAPGPRAERTHSIHRYLCEQKIILYNTIGVHGSNYACFCIKDLKATERTVIKFNDTTFYITGNLKQRYKFAQNNDRKYKLLVEKHTNLTRFMAVQ